MSDSETNVNWGGSRPGAGRKRKGTKLASSSTKVVRVDLDTADFIKSGGLEELLAVIADWDEQIETASPTSPRWSRARAMMKEIKAVLNDKDG